MSALLRKSHDSKINNLPEVEVRSTGTHKREFLRVEDLADLSMFLLNKYDGHHRIRKYVSGHNGRKYKDKNEHKRVWLENNREVVRKNGMKHKRKYYAKKRLTILAYRGNGFTIKTIAHILKCMSK